MVDMNDRALREVCAGLHSRAIGLMQWQVVVALGGTGNGFPRQDGFDITVASEVSN